MMNPDHVPPGWSIEKAEEWYKATFTKSSGERKVVQHPSCQGDFDYDGDCDCEFHTGW